MSKIKLEIFDREVEVVSYLPERSRAFIIEFTEATDGYIVMGGQTVRIKGKECAVDIRAIKDGEHQPRLVLEDKTIDLPVIIKDLGIVRPKEREINEIGELSLREKRLMRRVSELEKRLDKISEMVYGRTIF